jgi:hypothetical protein
MIPESINPVEAKALVLKVCDSVPAAGEFYVIGGEVRKIERIDEKEILMVTQCCSRYWVHWDQWRFLVDGGYLKFLSIEIDDYGLVTGDIDDSRAWDEAVAKARLLGLL